MEFGGIAIVARSPLLAERPKLAEVPRIIVVASPDFPFEQTPDHVRRSHVKAVTSVRVLWHVLHVDRENLG